jgi:type II secretory pathway component PulM
VSDSRSLGETLVSQLGTPRDYTAELLGGGVVLLLVLAYVSLEFGLARAFVRIARSIKSRLSHEPKDD